MSTGFVTMSTGFVTMSTGFVTMSTGFVTMSTGFLTMSTGFLTMPTCFVPFPTWSVIATTWICGGLFKKVCRNTKIAHKVNSCFAEPHYVKNSIFVLTIYFINQRKL